MKTLKYIILKAVFFNAALLIFNSCDDYLDVKPYNTLAHPSKLEDLRAILDNEITLTAGIPGHGEIASDDFYTGIDGLNYMLPYMQDAYLWKDNDSDGDSWRAAYLIISIANVVLEGLERIEGGDLILRNQLEGEALFYRGWMYFNLAQVYCAPYSVLFPEDNLGLPLRMDSNVKIDLKRSTLKETYEQIFQDLYRAADLMSNKSEYITRPSKLVALAALARAYLTIEDYKSAEEKVNQVMDIRKELLDFNSLDLLSPNPINIINNSEIFFLSKSNTVAYLITHPSTFITQELYSLYDETDLRKVVFFEENELGVKFKGFYHGDESAFYGAAQDEMYLIKAECLARRGEVLEGTQYLNTLLEKRYKTGSFQSLSFLSAEDLLNRVLEERRKELVFRGIRWLDLRRLNRYPEYAVTMRRELKSGESYSIAPNDLRYTFLIPYEVIDMGGYVQNPR